MNDLDPFYIGWQAKAAPTLAAWLRRVVLVLLLVAVASGVVLAISQRTIGSSVFEWGRVKEFSGVLKSKPYPHLLVARPGAKSTSSYYLVSRFKFGLDPNTANQFDNKAVTLKGTLIYRGNQTMVEVVDGSIKEASRQMTNDVETVTLGQQTLVGEIVDSKCYLGVMNPGQLAPHRACAIRCISGGIPPVLLVRQTNNIALYFVLVSSQGQPVNKQVLDLVAEPVEITGEVVRQGELLVLKADPAGYRRVK